MKKFLTLLLACAMLLLPVASLAEMGNATTITFAVEVPNADATTAGVVDLFNVLGIRVESGSTTASLQLQLSGETVLNIDATVQPDAVILGSNLLGTQTIGLTKSEVGQLLNQMVGNSQGIDFVSLMPYINLDELLLSMGDSMGFDLNSFFADDYPELTAVVNGWIDRSALNYGNVSLDGADPITSYRLISISASDLQDLLEAVKVTAQNNTDFAAGLAYMGYSANEYIQVIDQVSATIPQLYATVDAISLEIGYNAAGEVVYVGFYVTENGNESGSRYTAQHSGTVTVTTFSFADAGKSYSMIITEAPCTAPAKLYADNNTVYPLSMTSSQLSNWASQLQSNATMVLFSVIYKLPSSTMQLLMNSMY